MIPEILSLYKPKTIETSLQPEVVLRLSDLYPPQSLDQIELGWVFERLAFPGMARNETEEEIESSVRNSNCPGMVRKEWPNRKTEMLAIYEISLAGNSEKRARYLRSQLEGMLKTHALSQMWTALTPGGQISLDCYNDSAWNYFLMNEESLAELLKTDGSNIGLRASVTQLNENQKKALQLKHRELTRPDIDAFTGRRVTITKLDPLQQFQILAARQSQWYRLKVNFDKPQK